MNTTTTAEPSVEDMIFYRDIFHACEHNDLDGVKYYVEHLRMNVTVRNYDNETPAHCAARKCNELVLKYLLERDPRLTKTVDLFGNTILHLVTMCGSLKLVKYLIMERDMDMYEPASPHLGNGAVHMAAHAGWIHILRFFLEEKHADVNLLNRMNQTLVMTAALNKKLRVIRYLYEERKADLYLTDENNDNLLLVAARLGDLSVPLYLLEEKKLPFDVNWKDRFGGTVTHLGARHNHLTILRYFVGEKNADVNVRDTIGRTPLHEAVEQDHFEAVKYLIEQGADPLAADEFGKLPFQVTQNKEVIDYLKQNGSPAARKRRGLQESFFIPPIRYSSSMSVQEYIAGTDTIRTSPSRQPTSSINSFLTLITWMFFANKSSFRPTNTLTPPQSIRNRIDTNAINAVHALPVFEER